MDENLVKLGINKYLKMNPKMKGNFVKIVNKFLTIVGDNFFVGQKLHLF